jgi:xylulokinase
MSILALDVGSSRIKALLATLEGQLIEVRSTSTPRRSAEAGEHVYPADAVQGTIEELIAGLAAAWPRQPIRTLVFSCLGTAMVPVDREGRPLGPALAPADRRPLDGPGLAETVDMSLAELRQRTGCDPAVASSLMHFLWWWRTKPEVMAVLHRFRSLRGFAIQELCGADAEDATWASRTMLVDLETNRWSGAILAAAGLPAAVLPPIEPATTTLPVRRSAIERLGLAPGAVALLGAMDNCCSFLGAADTERSDLVNIVGTYEHMAGVASLAEVREVAGDSGAIVHTYLEPDRYIAMTRVALGELLALAAGGDLTRLDHLLEAVAATPRGDAIALTPEAVTEAICAGVPPPRVLQALLESEAAVLRRFVEAWPGDGSRRPIAAVGGGASHPAVLQLKANLLGEPLSTLASDEGAGIGALRLAAMVTQSMSSREASRLFPNPSVRTYYPIADATGPWRGMVRPSVSIHGGT